MKDSTASQLTTEPPQLVPVDIVAIALQSHGVRMEIASNYGRLLSEKILSCAPPGCDPKTRLKNSRTLIDPTSCSILTLVWRGSDFVTDRNIANAGLSRRNAASLSSYALAVKLADNPAHVAKLNTRIRGIGIAAAAYGLIQRVEVHRTLVELKGTALLHEFMMELAQMDMLTYSPFQPSIVGSQLNLTSGK